MIQLSNLPEQYRLMTAILEFTPALVMLQDAKSLEILMVNTHMEVFLGKTRSQILGKTIKDILTHDHGTLLEELALEVNATGHFAEREEIGLSDMAGQLKNLNYKMFPIRDEKEHIQYLLNIAEDITALRKLETSLLMNNGMLNLALRISNEGFWSWNLSNNEMYYSSHWNSMLGYEPGEIAPKFSEWRSLIHPEDVEHFYTQFQACTNEESIMVEVEYRMKTKKGSWVWILSKGQVFKWDESGSPLQMIGINQDITSLKLLESKLESLKLGLNESTIVAMTDLSGRITYANTAFCNISQYSQEELLGQDHRIVNSGYHPKQFFQSIWTVISAGNIWKGEIRNQAKNGQIYWVDTTIVPCLGSDGKPYQYIAIRHDITERKKLTEQLIQAEKDVASANQIRDQFLTSMNHEIRTPLNGVLSMSSLLLNAVLPIEQREYVQIIQSSAEALLKSLNDITDFSRIKSGQMSVRSIPFDLQLWLEQIRNEFSIYDNAQSVSFTVNCDPQLPQWLFGDPDLLRQVLVKLLDNAFKLTEAGSVSLTIKLVQQTEQQATICFEVEDTGYGLSEEQQHLLFERLMSVEELFTIPHQGQGLSLALCQALVGLMGSQIQVESQSGKGSLFRFTTVFSIEPGCLESPLLSSSDNNFCEDSLCKGFSRQYRILLVEDSVMNQRVTTLLLKKMELKLDIANNGVEALEMVSRADYDLILMDCRMPVLDGYETSRQLKQKNIELGRYLPIIALTANALESDREKCREAGMDDYLSKPIKFEELQNKLNKWLK